MASEVPAELLSAVRAVIGARLPQACITVEDSAEVPEYPSAVVLHVCYLPSDGMREAKRMVRQLAEALCPELDLVVMAHSVEATRQHFPELCPDLVGLGGTQGWRQVGQARTEFASCSEPSMSEFSFAAEFEFPTASKQQVLVQEYALPVTAVEDTEVQVTGAHYGLAA